MIASKNKKLIVRMTYLAVLSAIIVVLQLVGVGIKLPFLATPVSLVLVPIALGACLLGPLAGAFLGFVFGLVVTITCCFMGMDPLFTGILFQSHPVITVILCLSKSTLAGLASGLVYKAFARCKSVLKIIGTFIAAAVAPVVNTGVFILGCFVMKDTFEANFVASGSTMVYVLFISIAGLNFVFEFLINMVFAPAINIVIGAVTKQFSKKINKKSTSLRKYKAALFDMDGTLVDTYEGIENSLRYAFDKLGEPMVENPRRFIGPPLTTSFSEFCGYDEEKTELAIKYYREYYSEKGINECKLYDGIKDLLKDLNEAGVVVGIATSKPENFAHRVAQNLEILPYVGFVAGASEDEKTRTTKEQVLEYAIEKLGDIDKRDIVMIGDRHFDINGAKEFNLDSVGITFGFGSEDELREAGATFIAHNCEEIKKVILL